MDHNLKHTRSPSVASTSTTDATSFEIPLEEEKHPPMDANHHQNNSSGTSCRDNDGTDDQQGGNMSESSNNNIDSDNEAPLLRHLRSLSCTSSGLRDATQSSSNVTDSQNTSGRRSGSGSGHHPSAPRRTPMEPPGERLHITTSSHQRRHTTTSTTMMTTTPSDLPSVFVGPSLSDESSAHTNASPTTAPTTTATAHRQCTPAKSSSSSSSSQSRRDSNNNSISNTHPSIHRTPGAYWITKTRPPGFVQYRAVVPANHQPGSTFTVHAEHRHVQVRVPPDAVPGQCLDLNIPRASIVTQTPLSRAQLTASPHALECCRRRRRHSLGGARPVRSDVAALHAAATSAGGTARTYVVTIPDGVGPGDTFSTVAGGVRFKTTCPPGRSAGQKVRLAPPPERDMDDEDINDENSGNNSKSRSPAAGGHHKSSKRPRQQTFAVQVPAGVRPGGFFAFTVGTHAGQQVLVECPPTAQPGSTVHVKLETSAVANHIALEYETASGGRGGGSENLSVSPSCRPPSSGWKRTVRASDLKFQWARLSAPSPHSDSTSVVANHHHQNTDNDKEEEEIFDFYKSAYVRKITRLEGNDPRLPTAKVEFVPAVKAVVDSRLRVAAPKPDKAGGRRSNCSSSRRSSGRQTLFSYADIALQQGKPLSDKHAWFLSICRKRAAAAAEYPTGDAYVQLTIRRDHLLDDSLQAVLSLGDDDDKLLSEWRIRFVDEPGVDDGGVSREWFQLVTEQLLDPAVGLFVASKGNQGAVELNPDSGITCPDNDLLYVRFLGRVIGRALCDGKLVKGHLVRLLYKHLLGWPITVEDVKDLDECYFSSLQSLTEVEDLSSLCLDFTIHEIRLGERVQTNLREEGPCVEVSKDNLTEYLEANVRHRMFDRTLPQLTELLLGFYDIVPEPALTIFDASELELILCGLPTIDVNDWKAHTIYEGTYESKGLDEATVCWFWEVVEEFSTEMKARLLQFATGTSGVPAQGFVGLKGNANAIKPFTIYGVHCKTCLYPISHTCFNRIDLPMYNSKETLKERLVYSVTSSYTGFDME